MWETREEVTFYKNGLIRNQEDLKDFVPPNPFDYNKLDKVKEVVKNNEMELAIVGGIQDAFEIPSQMLGVKNFLINMYTNPQFVKKAINMSTQYNIERARSLIDLGVDAIISGDDYAYKSGPFMKPSLFKEFVFPYLRKIVNSVHRKGVPFIKHTDGYIWPIIDDIVEAGIDALHPIEPMARMDLKEVKERLGDKICVMGNVDVAHTLPFGSKEDVLKEVKDCICKAASGGGYIMSSSNSIHNAVKVQNFKVMIETTKNYGKYPLTKFTLSH
jgi:uroporphyrinogen decarboxylase